MNQIDELRRKLVEAIKIIDELSESIDVKEKKKRFSENGDVLIRKMCEFWNVSPEELKNKSRKGIFVTRRQIACFILVIYGMSKNGAPLTQQEIAQMLGYDNHSTVLHHFKIVDGAISGVYCGYDSIVKEVKAIEKTIGVA